MTELSETRMKWLKRLMISLAMLMATVEKIHIRTKLNALSSRKWSISFLYQNAALARFRRPCSKTMCSNSGGLIVWFLR